MTQPASNRRARKEQDPSIGRVFMDDLQRTKLRRDYLEELKQLYYFYVDDQGRRELAEMGRVKRAVLIVGWLLKSMFLKLSPARRLLVLAAFVFTVFGFTRIQGVTVEYRWISFALLLLVLMLELKDKLLARDEIAIAREVQLALLPSRHPEVPGWQVWSCTRPANDVGGDLVDYLEMDEFRHGVVLGDVAGKGLGAALLTAKLQATLRALISDIASLDDLGRRVNSIFFDEGLDNRYATLFFAQLEHDSGQLRYLNAGHNPPFVIHSDRIDQVHASSYPLGMLSAVEYEEGGVELQPGELMLIYSDGLTEAMNRQGEEFGVPRLRALLPEFRGRTPEEIGSRILSEVDRFMGEARPNDDLSIAVIVKR